MAGPRILSPTWVSWFLGAALLAAVIIAATRFSEERAFVRLAQQAEPWWLAVTVLLQAGTHVAQGGIWQSVAGAAGYSLSLSSAFELGLAKLFADQALPPAGLSSSALIAKALELRRVPAGHARMYSTVGTQMREGAAYWEILKVAAEGSVDLIVMGVQGRGALNLLLFGSNTARVSRTARCPVLIVPRA